MYCMCIVCVLYVYRYERMKASFLYNFDGSQRIGTPFDIAATISPSSTRTQKEGCCPPFSKAHKVEDSYQHPAVLVLVPIKCDS